MTELVLAFDIEHTGLEVIAIGASFVSTENYKDYDQVDSFFIGIYVEHDTKFSDRCYDEFWKKHLDILSTLEYKGDKSNTKEDREKEMILFLRKLKLLIKVSK